jgi:hypothetical protein
MYLIPYEERDEKFLPVLREVARVPQKRVEAGPLVVVPRIEITIEDPAPIRLLDLDRTLPKGSIIDVYA